MASSVNRVGTIHVDKFGFLTLLATDNVGYECLGRMCSIRLVYTDSTTSDSSISSLGFGDDFEDFPLFNKIANRVKTYQPIGMSPTFILYVSCTCTQPRCATRTLIRYIMYSQLTATDRGTSSVKSPSSASGARASSNICLLQLFRTCVSKE